jgi:hypothetical protein
MKNLLSLTALCFLLFGAPAGLIEAREYPKPAAMVNPLYQVTEDSTILMPSGYYEFGHWRYDLAGSDYDLFEGRTGGAATVLQYGGRMASGIFFRSLLRSGPGPDDWNPPTRIEWRLDSVQFEYGGHLAFRVPVGDLLFEYSRSSFHPFRDDAPEGYAVNTSDYVRLGYMPPPLEQGATRIEGYLKSGYLDLFDFWDAIYEKPRAYWKTTLALGAERVLTDGIRLDSTGRSSTGEVGIFGHIEPSLLLLRSGGADIDFYSELGLRFTGGFGRLDLFLHASRIGDTEELEAKEVEARLFGVALRLATQPGARQDGR